MIRFSQLHVTIMTEFILMRASEYIRLLTTFLLVLTNLARAPRDMLVTLVIGIYRNR
jgi:hypothetical protein